MADGCTARGGDRARQNLAGIRFYTQFVFPSETRFLFDRYVLLRGASNRAIKELTRKYHRLLQITTLHAGGRRLVLKNPVNTARIRLLLALYPNGEVHSHPSFSIRSLCIESRIIQKAPCAHRHCRRWIPKELKIPSCICMNR